jgi:hypothetical protein
MKRTLAGAVQMCPELMYRLIAIAAELFLSPHTIKSQAVSLYAPDQIN